MNIFVLSEDPVIAASYHCDQHLHKMILESAQMLSTAMWHWYPECRQYLYKPAYENHPCTLWVKQSISNAAWLAHLMQELQEIRYSLGCEEHSAMKIKSHFWTWSAENLPKQPTPFVFAGPPTIAISQKLSITEKYQKYYRQKHASWLLDKGRGMTYKNRPVPPFMADLISPNGT